MLQTIALRPKLGLRHACPKSIFFESIVERKWTFWKKLFFLVGCLPQWKCLRGGHHAAKHSEMGSMKGAPTDRTCPAAFPSTAEGSPLVPIVSFAPSGGCWASQSSPCAVRFLCSYTRWGFFLTLLEYAVNYILKYPYTFPLRGSYEQGSR